MPQEVVLPDGRTLDIPDDATPEQLDALRTKLRLETGAGMEAAAVQQSRQQLASKVKFVSTSKRQRERAGFFPSQVGVLGFAGDTEGLTSGEKTERAAGLLGAGTAPLLAVAGGAPGATGVLANVAVGGLGALEGARFGKRAAADLGLPTFVGAVPGAIAGAFLPKLGEKVLGPVARTFLRGAAREAGGIAPAAEAAAPAARRVILPGERIDPFAVESAGSAAQATTESLRTLAKAGDQSALRELVRRRALTPNIDFGKVPLPRSTPAEAPLLNRSVATAERRVAPGVSPTGAERRTVPLAEGFQGPPHAQLSVIERELKKPSLTEFERRTLISRWEDLTGRPYRGK